jgi:hypothetical protein
MKFQPVSSLFLSAVAYDYRSQTLYVRYNKMGTVVYSCVPPNVYLELLGSSSPDGYHTANIKSQYPSRSL